jgi:chromosome segregation ATPase
MVNQWGRDAGPSGANPGRSAGALIAAVLALVVGAGGGYGAARYVQGDAGAAVAARDQTISDLQADLDSTRSEAEKAGSREKSLEAELGDLDAEIKSLQSENDRLRAGSMDDDALAKENKDLRARLKAADKTAKEFAAAQKALDQAEADLAIAQKTVAARDAAIKDLRATLAEGGDLQAELDRVTRERDVLVTELREAQANLGDAGQLQRDFRTLKVEAAELRDRLKREAADRARAEDRAKDFETDIVRLTRQVAALEKQLAEGEPGRPRHEEPDTRPDPQPEDPQNPRNPDDVLNALQDMPGYDNLSAAKQKTLFDLLSDGQCVTDALKSVYGRVPAAALRNLLRDLRGAC